MRSRYPIESTPTDYFVLDKSAPALCPFQRGVQGRGRTCGVSVNVTPCYGTRVRALYPRVPSRLFAFACEPHNVRHVLARIQFLLGAQFARGPNDCPTNLVTTHTSAAKTRYIWSFGWLGKRPTLFGLRDSVHLNLGVDRANTDTSGYQRLGRCWIASHVTQRSLDVQSDCRTESLGRASQVAVDWLRSGGDYRFTNDVAYDEIPFPQSTTRCALSFQNIQSGSPMHFWEPGGIN